MNRYIYIIGLLVLFASCEKKSSQVLEGQPIYLSASLPEVLETKTPFEGSAPSTANPLNVDVWASTFVQQFKNEGLDGKNDNHNVSIHTKGYFQSGAPQLLAQAVYPPPKPGQGDAEPVYFVAMYPQSTGGKSWKTNTDGKQAIYTFTGCEDVMFAPQVSGTYDTAEQSGDVSKSPTLAFQHLLTRIDVKMGISLAQGENLDDAKEAWGTVTDIQIQDYYGQNLNTVTIDLTKGEAFSYGSDIAFTRSTSVSDVAFYAEGTDTPFQSDEGYELTDQLEKVAYTMCAPVTASNDHHEYVISVTTSNRGEQVLMLDLEQVISPEGEENSTRGNHFVVTLKFKKGRAVVSDVKVADWENGGFGIGNLDDIDN